VTRFSTPRGTQDILPDDWRYWDFVIGHAFETARLFGYRKIETPIFGDTALFARATGEGTDIVDKEMYTFQDREGKDFSLRPEGTAPVMRAYLEHGMHKLPQPVKLFYLERMYRYDRPQRGRFREHRQFGCEAIGSEDAYVDVEMISLLDTFYRRIGLDDLALRVNTIGDRNCRPAYLEALTDFLRGHEDRLAALDRERIERNPLRVLDSKERESQALLADAPHMIDYLCDQCSCHWRKLLHGLDVLGLSYEIDHRIVRGLDYYTRTVFEFAPPTDGQQSVVGGGGRYDDLSEAIGGPPIPGIGFGSGIERLVLNVRERGVAVPPMPHPEVYVAHTGAGTEDEALVLATRCRQRGIAADLAFGDRSLKAQMRHANAAQARYAAIIGEDELRNQMVTLRALESGDQRTVAAADISSVLEARAN
jgi:histidyl-tRNA synthetase